MHFLPRLLPEVYKNSRSKMSYSFAGMSLTSNSKRYYFKTLWKMIKKSQNFAGGYLSIKSTKIDQSNYV